MDFEGLTLNYLQQPVMRVIDFLNEHVLGLLTYDYKTPESIKSHPRRLRQIVQDPRLTNLKIGFRNFEINILILPLIPEKMKLIVRNIDIDNYLAKDYSRFIKKTAEKFQDFLFIDVMNINLQGITLLNYDEGFDLPRKISNEFGLEISIRRVLNSIEVIRFFEKNTEIDDGIKIKISSGSVKLQWQKADYLTLMKVLFNNLSYDDEMDDHIYPINLETKFCSYYSYSSF